MATQRDEGAVPFAISHELQQFRLLELPPEIVELIDSPDPPQLCIKSQVPPSDPNAPNAKAAYAVLCTPNKTFQLRQVQTSNSVFITQPTALAPPPDHGNDIPVPTTQAIASCTTTLELHPVAVSPASTLEELLPIYDIVDGEVDAIGNAGTKASILEHIPLSEGQFDQGWIEVLAFEVGGHSYRPTANTTTQVWKSVVAAALAEGVKLDTQFLTQDIAKLVAEEGFPGDLAATICKHLSTAEQGLNGPWSCLDQGKTVRFVGTKLLQARGGSSSYSLLDFLETWKENLPQAWHSDVKLSSIEGAYDQPTTSTITAKGAALPAAQAEKPGTKASARKWHEKFGKMRKR
ncbi:sister chromatid cohesion protein-like protein Dcc1 [Aaosphaeria arxii CBS 175.79]|uniref:Sister chromatid cohesion protein-like protein Dcc1 n=1 Tax=Aaosphaeria arxii CBS 175.79 TaxID=1450172 RepID=A0A6A5Y462_9PLEO|nr:sister chromatid cohesion protein-like protein Dcc1 [Aaosphaeria arxii CBS 175.79]KAF2020046.1 sister chromatid cohesion protein-like protein Dcc1 [Aaosphaeria arxii CBS 175.79]